MVRHTAQEWLTEIGGQVKQLRLDANLTQKTLAELADVTELTIRNLERGRGSSLATFVKVVRALNRDDWLSQFAPPIEVSPLKLLAEQDAALARRQRARVPR